MLTQNGSKAGEATFLSPPHRKSSTLIVISLVLTALLVSPFLYSDFTQRLPFPSDSDQDEYLINAQLFAEQFTFSRVRPLYSVWLGTIYVFSGKDLRRTFYVEKTVTVLLLSLLMAFLALVLFDARTAMLLFIWVLNCKYMLTEPNSSHAMATVMLVASALCLFLRNRAVALPASLFILFLSIEVREEMIVPVIFVVGCLLVREVYRWKRGERPQRPANSTAKYYWIGGVLAFAAMLALFAARPNNRKSPYLSILIRTEFAGTYVHRTGLRNQLPGKKAWVPEAWDVTYERLPGVNNDWDLIRLYPGEVLANIIYNIKITPRVLGAMFLAFDRPVVMGGVLILYLLSYLVWPGNNGRFQAWRPIPDETRRWLIVWAIGTSLIVALIMPLYVSSRHFVQLIPVEIVVATFILRWVMSKLFSLRSTKPAAAAGA